MSLVNRSKEEWIGYRQGKLVVINKIGEKEFIKKSHNKEYKYILDILLVECSCGKKTEVNASSFIHNNIQSCRGCLKRRNDIGKKFGKLTVIGWHNKLNASGRSYIIYDCMCDCGNSYSVRNEFIINSETTTCNKCRKSSKITFNKTSIDKYFKSIKYRCKKNNIELDLNSSFLLSLLESQSYKCHYSNKPISFEDGTASLDRIDNTIGYIKTNVRWVHRTINYMKNEMSDSEFLDFCACVAKNRGGPAGPAPPKEVTFFQGV